jgi:carbon-monoxide dehydrogenase medium subunit
MIPAGFEYFTPTSLPEALELLSNYKDDVKILAGGQSLVPLMKLRLAKPRYVIDLSGVGDLNYIREAGGAIYIGTLATHSDIEHSELILRHCPLLAQTAATIADVQVRNRGTLGGSLAHADPAGDMPAAILALDAEMKAAQRASGFAVVGVAVRLRLAGNGNCDDIAIGLTGVTDKAYRAKTAEDELKGKRLDDEAIERAAQRVMDRIDPLEDINGSKEYRAHLAQVYTARALRAALAQK